MVFETLIAGSELFFTRQAILLTALGCFFGLIIGVLPGLGPLMGIILAVPIAFYLPPVPGIGMLVAIYVGGSCGGAVSAILLRIPGTPLAAATLLDGHPMAQKGRAGDAIGLAISASALGGIIGGIVLVLFAPFLAAFALKFGPPEYFALTIMGLVTIAVVSQESAVKGFITGAFGLLISTIGTDQFSNAYRFTFDFYELLSGVHIVAVVVGLFALSEMFFQIETGGLRAKPDIKAVKVSFASLRFVFRHKVNLVRSSLIGTFFGALPGAGGVLSSFTAYAVAKSSAKDEPVPYGEGAEGGIVATESANNATCGGSLIPTLALGLPGEATSAVLLGALFLLGFFPGPQLFEQNIDMVGGLFLAFLSANVFLIFLGILMTPIFVSVLRMRKMYMIPVVVLLSTMGVYALQSSSWDLWVMFVFGVIGYILRKFDYPLAPIVIGAVLGPVCEGNLRRSLLISQDGLAIFWERPISATLLAINLILILWVMVPAQWRPWNKKNK